MREPTPTEAEIRRRESQLRRAQLDAILAQDAADNPPAGGCAGVVAALAILLVMFALAALYLGHIGVWRWVDGL